MSEKTDEKSEKNVESPELQRACVEYNQKLAQLQYEIEQLVRAALTGLDHHTDMTVETIDVRLERLNLFIPIIQSIRELILNTSFENHRQVESHIRQMERLLERFVDTHDSLFKI